jgi:hypothetical protein
MKLKRSLARSNLSNSNSIGVRLQGMGFQEQGIVLARVAQNRTSGDQFSPKDLEDIFFQSSLPKPTNTSDVIGKLRSARLLTSGSQSGTWRMTPLGRQVSVELLSDLDLAALSAESMNCSSVLGHVAHTVVPPAFAPPSLIQKLRHFLSDHPFETNVFGMTRFPQPSEDDRDVDPVKPSLEIAREVCRLHGLQFHLASDRAIDDDLWTNVAAHMWACRYGIAFFEDRRSKGLNYNLTIEVGSMLITGRRCALLKDRSIDRMPTDLVGQIYKSVDLGKPNTVSDALHEWFRQDLNLGRCPHCPALA